MSSDHGHDEIHRPVSFYIGIAVMLGIITAVELGPLFDWYNIPTLVLLALSAFKFFVVVAFFMHLWDDDNVYSQLFGYPLVGSIMMVGVLMLLFKSYFPSPLEDSFAVQERYWENYSSECTSWLVSHRTNRQYCASPAIDQGRVFMHLAAGGGDAGPAIDIDLASMDDAGKKAALMELGETKYNEICAACHQKSGEGVPPAFPPLKGSGEFYGDAKNHATIIVKGLSGEIEVQGVKYNGVMVPHGFLSDLEIAAIATYERNAWGNNDGIVMPADVAAVR